MVRGASFGLLGVVLRRLGNDMALLVLGVPVEQNLRRSLLLSDGDWSTLWSRLVAAILPGVCAPGSRRAAVLERMPASRENLIGSAALLDHGGARSALPAPPGHVVRVGLAHLAGVTLTSGGSCA